MTTAQQEPGRVHMAAREQRSRGCHGAEIRSDVDHVGEKQREDARTDQPRREFPTQ
jgi:hypothetical protein